MSREREAVIVSAVRTPVGSFQGALAALSAVELGGLVIKEAVRRAGVAPELVEEIVFGQVLQAGQGQNPARQAALKAGLSTEAAACTINKVCGSGLKSVNLAAQAIAAGDADIVVAGGMESMSNAPYLLDSRARSGCRMGHGQTKDVMIQDGLWCAFNDYHMGITAENVANHYGISRLAQDELAAASQAKAAAAQAQGAFAAELMSVEIVGRKGTTLVERDEHPRSETTMETLQRLKPAFLDGGTVTAGNASGLNDGAAALVVMSRSKADFLGLRPLARILSYGDGGVEPGMMGMGPVPATRQALAKAGLEVRDLELIEANEAFAAQSLAVAKELGFASEKVNVHGGAIALGHPIGASGARILTTLIHALHRHNKKIGLATLCVGGGQGVATIIERE